MSTLSYNPTGVIASTDFQPTYYSSATRVGLSTADRAVTETLTGSGPLGVDADFTVLASSGPFTFPAGTGSVFKTILNANSFPGDFAPSLRNSAAYGDRSMFPLASTGTTVYVAGSTGILTFSTASKTFVPNTGVDGKYGNGGIYAMACVGNRLYVGGGFSTFGGVACSNFVAYDSASGTWFNPAAGPNAEVRAMVAIGTNLYLGGVFTSPGIRVGMFSTTTNTFSNPFGAQGMGASVNALAASGTLLHIGGDFATANGAASNNLATFNTSGGTWTPYPSLFNGNVRSLLVAGPRLYAGGEFTTVNAVANRYLVQFTSPPTVSAALGNALDGGVYSLAPHPSTGWVYAAGTFLNASGVVCNHLALWSGTGVSAVGLGFSGVSYSPGLIAVGSEVYAASRYGLDLSSPYPQLVCVSPYTNTRATVSGYISATGLPYTGTVTLPYKTGVQAVLANNGVWYVSTASKKVSFT